MDKRFLKYIKDKKSVALISLTLALGLILIFIGGRNDGVEIADVGIEERLSVACSGVDGVGECEVLVYYSSSGSRDGEKVESVIVICDGADSADVRLRLTEMLSSFFGIGSNRIRVEKRNVYE